MWEQGHKFGQVNYEVGKLIINKIIWLPWRCGATNGGGITAGGAGGYKACYPGRCWYLMILNGSNYGRFNARWII